METDGHSEFLGFSQQLPEPQFPIIARIDIMYNENNPTEPLTLGVYLNRGAVDLTAGMWGYITSQVMHDLSRSIEMCRAAVEMQSDIDSLTEGGDSVG